MSLPDWIHTFVAPLEGAGITYAITGSVASMLYGELRATHDVDIVVAMNAADADRVIGLYSEDRFYVPDRETILDALRGSGSFNIIDQVSGFKADFFPARQSAAEAWALAHRIQVSEGDSRLWLVPPEYVIVRKLLFYREGRSPKHLRDIRGILQAKTPLDRDVLNRMLSEFDVRREWEEAQG